MKEDFIIHFGNCLKIMQSMAEGSVNSVITDPPHYDFEFNGSSPEEYWGEFEKYYKEMLRVCDGDNRLAISQPPDRHAHYQNILQPTRILIIDDGFSDGRGESADFLLFNPRNDDAQTAENWPEDIVPTTFHPNDRVVNKMAKLVKTMTNPGDTVLDPFCGSGAIGVACVLLGRKYIGIELLMNRADDARKRLEAAWASPLRVVQE